MLNPQLQVSPYKVPAFASYSHFNLHMDPRLFLVRPLVTLSVLRDKGSFIYLMHAQFPRHFNGDF